MTKLHGMAETMQIGDSIESWEDAENATVDGPLIHGMTQTLDLENPGEVLHEDRMPTAPSSERPTTRQDLSAGAAPLQTPRRRYILRAAGMAFAAGIFVAIGRSLRLESNS